MTAHELARKLLDCPDVEVVTHFPDDCGDMSEQPVGFVNVGDPVVIKAYLPEPYAPDTGPMSPRIPLNPWQSGQWEKRPEESPWTVTIEGMCEISN